MFYFAIGSAFYSKDTQKVLCLKIPSIFPFFGKIDFMDKFFKNDGWPSWGWWVTILGMVGYHPMDFGSPLYSARSLTMRPRAWYLYFVRRLMFRLWAHSLYFVRSLRLRLRCDTRMFGFRANWEEVLLWNIAKKRLFAKVGDIVKIFEQKTLMKMTKIQA